MNDGTLNVDTITPFINPNKTPSKTPPIMAISTGSP